MTTAPLPPAVFDALVEAWASILVRAYDEKHGRDSVVTRAPSVTMTPPASSSPAGHP